MKKKLLKKLKKFDDAPVDEEPITRKEFDKRQAEIFAKFGDPNKPNSITIDTPEKMIEVANALNELNSHTAESIMDRQYKKGAKRFSRWNGLKKANLRLTFIANKATKLKLDRFLSEFKNVEPSKFIAQFASANPVVAKLNAQLEALNKIPDSIKEFAKDKIDEEVAKINRQLFEERQKSEILSTELKFFKWDKKNCVLDLAIYSDNPNFFPLELIQAIRKKFDVGCYVDCATLKEKPSKKLI